MEAGSKTRRSRNYLNETRRLGSGIIVRAYSILSTETVAFEAWEPETGPRVDHGHSTITSFDGEWYGTVTSRRIPDEIAALPYGGERTERVHAYWRSKEAERDALVAEAFPELAEIIDFESFSPLAELDECNARLGR